VFTLDLTTFVMSLFALDSLKSIYVVGVFDLIKKRWPCAQLLSLYMTHNFVVDSMLEIRDVFE